MPLPYLVTETIKIFLDERAKMLAAENRYPNLFHNTYFQAPADRIHIGELAKIGDMYSIKYLEDPFTLADGSYIFVVPSSTPWRILCSRMGKVDGHTSLGREYIQNRVDGKFSDKEIVGDVYYAGEMLFVGGHLRHWNNRSGHYQPNDEKSWANLLPHVRAMLPRISFSPSNVPLNPIVVPPPPPPLDFNQLNFSYRVLSGH